MLDLSTLNEKQYKAVTSPNKYIRVIDINQDCSNQIGCI